MEEKNVFSSLWHEFSKSLLNYLNILLTNNNNELSSLTNIYIMSCQY